MHVAMEYALAGSLTDVDAYVVAVKMVTIVYLLLHVLQHDVHIEQRQQSIELIRSRRVVEHPDHRARRQVLFL